jgi:hypothetical protein
MYPRLTRFVHENEPEVVLFKAYFEPRFGDTVTWQDRLGGGYVEYKVESVRWAAVAPIPLVGEPGALHCQYDPVVTLSDV